MQRYQESRGKGNRRGGSPKGDDGCMEAERITAHTVIIVEAGTWEGRMVWKQGWDEAGECWRKDSTCIPYGPSENTRGESEGRGLVIPGNYLLLQFKGLGILLWLVLGKAF